MSHHAPPQPAADPEVSVSSTVFDPEGLFPGDVVLERSVGKQSNVIMAVDGGSYSHVLMHLGSGEFIEAIDGGSRSISFLRLPIDEPERWSLLRYVGAGKMSRTVAAQAALEARNLAHMPYNLWGAVTSIAPLPGRPSTALFCSELVAEAFRRAGAEIEPGLPPEKTTPRVVERSSRFVAITPLPLMPGVSPAGDRDEAYAATPMNAENQLVQRVFAQLMERDGPWLRDAAKPYGVEPRSLFDLLSVLAAADEKIAEPIAQRCHELLSEGGYYDFLSADRKAETLSRAGGAPDILVNTWLDGLQRHARNHATFKAIATQRPWPLWKAMRDMFGANEAFFETLVTTARPSQFPADQDR